MITAKDIHKRLLETQKIDEKALDTFIEAIIVPKFETARALKITVSESTFTDMFAELKPAEIVKIFTSRGFRMEYKSEDRPCGRNYYELEIPPQGE